MSMTLLSIILDCAVMAALAGTIYFAMRLSNSLNNFRAHRNEMKTLIAELSKNINDAHSAIEGLKATSNIAADNLDDVLHDSRRMAEELKMINETGESLAGRLEKLASSARGRSGGSVRSPEFEEDYYDEPQAANTDSGPDGEAVEPPSFFIQDREFDDEETAGGNKVDEDFVSEAEKDLYKVLQGYKKSGGGRV